MSEHDKHWKFNSFIYKSKNNRPNFFYSNSKFYDYDDKNENNKVMSKLEKKKNE